MSLAFYMDVVADQCLNIDAHNNCSAELYIIYSQSQPQDVCG